MRRPHAPQILRRAGSIVRRLALTLAVLLHLPATAEVVLVPRSEVFAYMMGQHMARVAENVAGLQVYSGNFLAGYAELNRLRKELSACGSCAKREPLIRQIAELQAYLIRENEMLCNGIDAVRDMPLGNAPGLDAVNKITGLGSVCENYKREVEIQAMKVSLRKAQERFDARLKRGDNGAYHEMGTWIHQHFQNSRAMSNDDRYHFACLYLMTGARKGDLASLLATPGICHLNQAEHQEVTRLLVQCTQARKTEDRCAHGLQDMAAAYSTSRSARRTYPVEPDEKELLRLRRVIAAYWEQRHHAAPQDPQVRERLAAARRLVDMQEQSVQPLPGAGTSGREEIHSHMRQWCEGIRERVGRVEMLSYDCPCFVRETDRLLVEGRLVFANVKRDGMFDFNLIDACVDRPATADAWVAHQRTQMPAGDGTDRYLACAHDAIASTLPLANLKERYAAGWKGSIAQKCPETGSRTAQVRGGSASVAPPTRRAPSPEIAPAETNGGDAVHTAGRTQRVAPQDRRCAALRSMVERAESASLRDPVRYASRHQEALARYQRACGD